MDGTAPAALRLDLHLHSDASDGRHDPDELLRRCAAGGLDVVALTDHDLPPQRPAGPWSGGGRALRVVHGVELSGRHEDQELHLLAWFPGDMPAAVAALCRERARARAERYDRARASLGLPGVAPADDAARRGERSLTRHHLARALVEAGHARSVGDAFQRLIGRAQGHVPPVEVRFVDLVGRVREEGGFCSWAHPPPDQARAWTRTFAQAGLHALEAWRPGLGRFQRDALVGLALRHGLSVTGGSDWHGWGPPEPGAFAFSGRQAAPFLRFLGLH
jgi:3',5'-nucleoside bisphosphate phosphatase